MVARARLAWTTMNAFAIVGRLPATVVAGDGLGDAVLNEARTAPFGSVVRSRSRRNGCAAQACAGDMAYVITSYLLLNGYLRDIGMHIPQFQRSINEMEELVQLHRRRWAWLIMLTRGQSGSRRTRFASRM
jgi:hypothetical protein